MAKKKPRARKMSKLAERAMRGSFDSFMDSIEERAAKGDSEAEWSTYGYTDGQLETLRKMFVREGFAFTKNLTATFTVRW